jgi:hypothetical protein
MSDELRSIVLGTAGLSLALAMAGVLTLARPARGDSVRLRTVVDSAVLVLAIQCAHVTEELSTGFPARFPVLLGLAPWPIAFFVPFNAFWIVVWGISCYGVMGGRRAAMLPLWFLAIASVANGVAHPLMSARTGGYFPGLFTSPLLGVAGVVLVRRLLRVTGYVAPQPGAA